MRARCGRLVSTKVAVQRLRKGWEGGRGKGARDGYPWVCNRYGEVRGGGGAT